jgi:ornithine cyclodeaminase/alanine dehydrogenase-like protein (mu-crystallin family)
MSADSPVFIDHNSLVQLLPLADCVALMAPAMRAASAGSVPTEPRLKESFAGGKGGMLLMRAESAELGYYAIKQISFMPDNARRGLPVIQGLISLFELDSGSPVAVLDGTAVTTLRTAAASGLATRELARANARSLGIFGTGVQVRGHIAAISAVRDIDEVVIWGRNPDHSRALVAELSDQFAARLTATTEPSVAAGCDVVCTLTGASEPVLRGEWVRPGTHVNLVGAHSLNAREADSSLMSRARVYCDLLDSVRAEAGDIVIPIEEGVFAEDHIVGEIGELLAGSVAGRADDSQITLYKSLGVAAQDLYSAHWAYRAWLERHPA